jgi:hypothetical protein
MSIMISSTPTLEQRVEQLERELAQIKQQMQPTPQPSDQPSELPWWEKIVGVFADDPDFEAAVELGREYRQSLKPIADSDEPPHVSP